MQRTSSSPRSGLSGAGPEQEGADTVDRVPAASDPRAVEVLEEWQRLTGHVLRPERQPVFLARPVVAALAAVDSEVRRDTGRRLWRDMRQLLLDDWALECACPGAVALAPPWSAIAERDDDTTMVLRELLAAAVDEIPAERSRQILARRIGAGDQDAQSMEKIAGAFGLSRERVRQLQNRTVRAMARARTPATSRLRALLSDLGRLEGPPPEHDDGPGSAERLLDLSQVLCPSMAPRQAVALLAALTGVRKLPADNLAAQAMTIRVLRQDTARRESSRQGRVERAEARWSRLDRDVRWFGTPESAPPRTELEALRQADGEEPGSGSWHCPKLGRAVAYESETELRVIQLLSFAPQVAYYQEQPLAIGYGFDGRSRTYFPDLLVATTDGRCVLVEVKPVFEMATAVNLAKYRALETLCRERGWGLLVTDGNRTHALLEEHRPDPRLIGVIGPLLARGTVLGWPQVLTAAGEQRPGSLDIASLVLRHGWDWRTRPFRLRAGESVPEPASAVVAQARQEAVLPDRAPAPPSPGEPVRPTPEEIEAARTPAGGWSRGQLAAWGVPWPPPKGWKRQLTAQTRPECP
nr:hypothetical protein KPHV_83350 [Kitasatospora purpeofusca]